MLIGTFPSLPSGISSVLRCLPTICSRPLDMCLRSSVGSPLGETFRCKLHPSCIRAKKHPISISVCLAKMCFKHGTVTIFFLTPKAPFILFLELRRSMLQDIYGIPVQGEGSGHNAEILEARVAILPHGLSVCMRSKGFHPVAMVPTAFKHWPHACSNKIGFILPSVVPRLAKKAVILQLVPADVCANVSLMCGEVGFKLYPMSRWLRVLSPLLEARGIHTSLSNMQHSWFAGRYGGEIFHTAPWRTLLKAA